MMANCSVEHELEEDDEYLHIAVNALKAIRSGKATATISPYQAALYGRLVVEKYFEKLAIIYTITPSAAVLLFGAVIVIFGSFCIGLVRANSQSTLDELFISGDDKENLDYTDSFLSGELSTLETVLQFRPEKNLSQTNFTNSLLDHVELVRSIVEFPITHNGRNYTFYDLCTYGVITTGVPDFDRVVNGLHTCAIFTTLDCYWEGSIVQNPPDSVLVESPYYCQPEMPQYLNWSNFDYTEFIECLATHPNESMYNEQVILALSALGYDGYLDKDCFSQPEECPTNVVVPDSNLYRNVGTCKGANNGAITPYQIVTGYEGNDSQTDQLRVLRTVFLLGGSESVQNNLLANNISLSHSEVLGVLTRWRDRIYDFIIDYDEGRAKPRSERYSQDRMYGFTSNFYDNLADDLSIVAPALVITGYVLMILYCGAAFFKFDLTRSRSNAGLVGVFLVLLGTAAALGITAAGGIEFTLLTAQIYPFLVLGLGVDDMFVIVGTFLEMEQKKGKNAPIKDLIKETMVAVGPSITLTSVTNFVGFLLSYIIPLPVFRLFVVEVAVAIAFNYIALVIGMPCYLIIDYYRSHGKLMDVLCCIPVWWHKDKKEVIEKTGEPGKSSFVKSVCSWISQANKEYNSVLTWFVVKYYSPVLQNYMVKYIVLVVYCLIIGICCWGVTKTELTTDQTDFGKDDTPFIEYAEINQNYVEVLAFSIVTKQIDYPNLQPNLLRMDESIRNLSNVLAPTISNEFWLTIMIEYYQGLHLGVCLTNNPDLQSIVTLIISVVDPIHFEVEPSCATVPFNRTCLCSYQLLTSAEYRERNWTIIPPDKFYLYLTFWGFLDTINMNLLGAFLNPQPLPFNISDPSTTRPSNPLGYAQANFYVHGLVETDDGIDHITDVEDILDSHGIDGYNLGEALINYSPLVHLREQISLAAGFIIIACFVTTTIFLMDIHSGILMGLVLVSNGIQVLGFMAYFDIALTYFAATVYLAGIAIGVEFTAPLVFYFLKATSGGGKHASSDWWIIRELGSRNERMHKALEHRFTPIFNGGITTFVSIVMIYFVPVRFVRLFYFGVLMIVVVVGMVNGLVFLPVILSIIGPFAQVTPTNTVDEKPTALVTINPGREGPISELNRKPVEVSTFTH